MRKGTFSALFNKNKSKSPADPSSDAKNKGKSSKQKKKQVTYDQLADTFPYRLHVNVVEGYSLAHPTSPTSDCNPYVKLCVVDSSNKNDSISSIPGSSFLETHVLKGTPHNPNNPI